MKCEKCGAKTILASGVIHEFIPDAEPYENGKVEDLEFTEITIEKSVLVTINWCSKCEYLQISDTEII